MSIKPEKLLEGSQIKLSAKQRKVAANILRWTAAKGYPTHVGIAAVTNAYAESELKPDAKFTEGSGWMSVGLFQLNTGPNGAGSAFGKRAGKGNVPKVLLRAKKNFNVLFKREKKKIKQHVETAKQGDSAAYMFSLYVERPANGDQRAQERMILARKLFPEYAQQPAGALAKTTSTPFGLPPLVLAGAAVGVVGLVLVGFSRSRWM